MKLKNDNFNSFGLNDIFHGLSRFAAEYPADLHDNLEQLFNLHYKNSPLVCFAMFANSLTRQALCDDEFFRDHRIFYPRINVGDYLRQNPKVDMLYSSFPVDYPLPQWRYREDGNTNEIIFMLNILLDIVHFDLRASIGEYVREAVIEPNKPEGIIIEINKKFMVLAVVDETPFHYHAALSNADGTNCADDYFAYHAFPILNGIKVFNFGDKPVKVLYMPAI